MSFYVKAGANQRLDNGVELEWTGPGSDPTAGSVRLVYDKDRSEIAQIDVMGFLMAGGKKLQDDYVADITVGDRRFGMRRFGTGKLGSRWMIVGAPYNEPMAA